MPWRTDKKENRSKIRGQAEGKWVFWIKAWKIKCIEKLRGNRWDYEVHHWRFFFGGGAGASNSIKWSREKNFSAKYNV